MLTSVLWGWAEDCREIELSASAGVFSNLLRSEKLGRRANKLLVYMTGQGLVQLVNLSVGLLLIRWLKIEGYAQYSVAFSFQTTFSLLTDLGFAGTIVALVGPRGNDPEVVGKYIRSGRHLRNTMLAWLTPVAAILYIGISRQHHWPVVSSTLLFLSIASSIYFSGMVSYYGGSAADSRQALAFLPPSTVRSFFSNRGYWGALLFRSNHGLDGKLGECAWAAADRLVEHARVEAVCDDAGQG